MILTAKPYSPSFGAVNTPVNGLYPSPTLVLLLSNIIV